jgi:flagellar assembly protein FliH
MKLCKSISLPKSVRHIRLASASSPAETGQRERQDQQDAYERGRHDAEKAIGEQLLQQRTELLQLHQGVVESLRSAIPQVVRDTERTLIELALEAAGKVVAGLPIESNLVEAVVREALSQVEDKAEITVQLHPDDLLLLRKHQSPILEGAVDSGPLRFAGSSEISRGGCVVHTRFGFLDARRETKLDQLRDSVPA